MTEHRGWHERGYLPHFDAPDRIQHIVFRLHGSLPAYLLERLNAGVELADERRALIDLELDRGLGPTWLVEPDCAAIVATALRHFDGERYKLLAWCVMPNHVHALIDPVGGWSISRIVKSWKAFSASMINRRLGRRGAFWAPDYFDRFIRDLEQLEIVIDYIEANPVTAGLCRSAGDWPWSSAPR